MYNINTVVDDTGVHIVVMKSNVNEGEKGIFVHFWSKMRCECFLVSNLQYSFSLKRAIDKKNLPKL